MSCCGRCKVCRPEWEELEDERDRLAAEVERLMGMMRRLNACYGSAQNMHLEFADIRHELSIAAERGKEGA